ncbi:hypothetical protein BOW53_04600 [Solemya pervernicosa gill symbiont]|uniref:C_GCAxxG_C_C family protein n=2 Tax=Gammaproteobacteria incertae sedis TaxID=118884 RepID=A0A1T2L854_9GAMM|nr:C-GCAxxG-C-C family protein [Candidatus Reidiella endopervernicosa]OOZ41263.1 hypothetical protein BOW53_04600 [Solemya pervernicosa gill symbiont]QKQ25252.1 C_GCAxxG_C_C family protein [Candidatus Reidiella endopervernicosa]
MSKCKEIAEKFCNGTSCSQAILSSYAEQYGLAPELAFKIAAGFSGGMGRTGNTCGALTGAIMVAGLEKGATHKEDQSAKQNTYDTVGELIAAFEQRWGTTECRELLGCNIGTAEGYEAARDQALFIVRCPEIVESAVEILERVIDQAEEE